MGRGDMLFGGAVPLAAGTPAGHRAPGHALLNGELLNFIKS